MNRLLLIVLICVFMSACVNTQNVAIDTAKTNSFQSKSITKTNREKSDFVALTPGKAISAAAGIVGAVVGNEVMLSHGNTIVKNSNIDDPSSYISTILLDDFTKANQAQLIPNNNASLEVESIEEIAALFPDVDYVLDIRTLNWGFSYYANIGKQRYHAYYIAKLRLIETKLGAMIAEGFCRYNPKKTPDSPSYDQLLADRAFLIKSELRVAANKCIDEFRVNVLNLPVTPLETISPDPKEVTPVIVNGVVSPHSEIINSLNSNSSPKLRETAVHVYREKLYSEEEIILTMINLLEVALKNGVSKTERSRIDALGWCLNNIAHSKDSRALPVLNAMSQSKLPRKLKRRAANASKRISKELSL